MCVWENRILGDFPLYYFQKKLKVRKIVRNTEDMRILPSRVPSRTLWVGKLIVPLVDSKETSGAKTESADGRSRKRNNLKKLGVMMMKD